MRFIPMKSPTSEHHRPTQDPSDGDPSARAARQHSSRAHRRDWRRRTDWPKEAGTASSIIGQMKIATFQRFREAASDVGRPFSMVKAHILDSNQPSSLMFTVTNSETSDRDPRCRPLLRVRSSQPCRTLPCSGRAVTSPHRYGLSHDRTPVVEKSTSVASPSRPTDTCNSPVRRAMAVVRYAQQHGTQRPSLVPSIARHQTKVATAALANKTARMISAVVTSGKHYPAAAAQHNRTRQQKPATAWEKQTACNPKSVETPKPENPSSPERLEHMLMVDQSSQNRAIASAI